jgi:hypothetical protein
VRVCALRCYRVQRVARRRPPPLALPRFDIDVRYNAPTFIMPSSPSSITSNATRVSAPALQSSTDDTPPYVVVLNLGALCIRSMRDDERDVIDDVGGDERERRFHVALRAVNLVVADSVERSRRATRKTVISFSQSTRACVAAQRVLDGADVDAVLVVGTSRTSTASPRHAFAAQTCMRAHVRCNGCALWSSHTRSLTSHCSQIAHHGRRARRAAHRHDDIARTRHSAARQ